MTINSVIIFPRVPSTFSAKLVKSYVLENFIVIEPNNQHMQLNLGSKECIILIGF